MSQAKLSPKPDLLTSWKEIANYMGKGVRTVQRWEATLGLPVIRPSDSRSGIVIARRSDLEAWVLNGRPRLHLNLGSQSKQEDGVRATFAACVQDLRRYHSEVKALCDQMNALRATLEGEIQRLKFLCEEWHEIRGRTLGKENLALSSDNPTRPAQVN